MCISFKTFSSKHPLLQVITYALTTSFMAALMFSKVKPNPCSWALLGMTR